MDDATVIALEAAAEFQELDIDLPGLGDLLYEFDCFIQEVAERGDDAANWLL